jgi:hypothetical protein
MAGRDVGEGTAAEGLTDDSAFQQAAREEALRLAEFVKESREAMKKRWGGGTPVFGDKGGVAATPCGRHAHVR